MENVMTFAKIILSYSACLRQYFYDFIFDYSIRRNFGTQFGASG